MKSRCPLGAFEDAWARSLVQRHHDVEIPKGVRCVLQSRNSGRKRYRWLLFVAEATTRTLNRFEREDVEYQLKRARELKQEAYVVVRFEKPSRKVVVLPAASALQQRTIHSIKGGIPWCD